MGGSTFVARLYAIWRNEQRQRELHLQNRRLHRPPIVNDGYILLWSAQYRWCLDRTNRLSHHRTALSSFGKNELHCVTLP